jgi:adenine-specific DNA-methyltransferase
LSQRDYLSSIAECRCIKPTVGMRGVVKLEYPGKISAEKLWEEVTPAELTPKWRIALNSTGAASCNQLLYGDNLPVLRRLVEDPRVAGKVRTIYIDPPFATGRAVATRDGHVAYYDILTGHEFLEFLRARLVFLRDLLAEDGSIYVHIDATIGHYVKVILDEIFGPSCFRNDITRIKCNPKNFERKAYGNYKDTILFYSRTPATVANDPLLWNDHRRPLTDDELKRQFPRVDSVGRRYATTPLHAPGETRNGPTGQEWKGLLPPRGRHWRYPPDELTRLDEAGLVEWSSTGNPRMIIRPENNKGKKIQDVWEYKDRGAERATYPTEKNLDLLRFIIQNSSNPGDLIMDAFAGSGTTLLAANELGRSWIGLEASPLGVSVCQSRLSRAASSSDMPVDFEVSETQIVPAELTKPVPMSYQVLGADSLFSDDVHVEVDLDGATSMARGQVAAILVDPDFQGSSPRLTKAVIPAAYAISNKTTFRAKEVGKRIFVLVLHKTGDHENRRTVKLSQRASEAISRTS